MMRNTPSNFDEKTYVEMTLSNIHGLVCKSQPSLTEENWFTKVERRNYIERMYQDYERAIAEGFAWAQILEPSHFVPNWLEQLRFVQEIDSKRFSFIQFCDGIAEKLDQLADAYQELDSDFSLRLGSTSKLIKEVRENYSEPQTSRRKIVRLK